MIKKEIIKVISLLFTLNMTLASLIATLSSPLTGLQGANPIDSCLKAEFLKTALRFPEDCILTFRNQVNSCAQYFTRKSQNNKTKITPHTKQTHTFALPFYDISLNVCFYVVSLRKSRMGRYFRGIMVFSWRRLRKSLKICKKAAAELSLVSKQTELSKSELNFSQIYGML